VNEEALISWAALQAVFYAIPLFLFINFLTALISASGEIKKRGFWCVNKFIFHEPLHIYTTEFSPKDNGTNCTFKVKDVEPNCFVQFKLEHEGGIGVASIGPPIQLSQQLEAARSIKYGSRISSKQTASVWFQCPANSNPTIIRIYVISWEL